MPPALRAHVIIPVFRGAYAPRYEYAAPVGALFSLIPSLYSYRPCRGFVFCRQFSRESRSRVTNTSFPVVGFYRPYRAQIAESLGHTLLFARYEYAAPVGALFSLIPLSIFIPSPVGALFSAVNSAESPDPALRIHRSLWWGGIVVIELKLRNHWDIHCFLLAKCGLLR